MPPFITGLFQQALQTASRSSALQPLAWIFGLLLAGLIGAFQVDATPWVVELLAVLLVVCFAVYIGTFVYLLIKDRDALRSERFTLNKMAIERGLFGDSESGLRQIPPSTTGIDGNLDRLPPGANK